MLIDLEKPETPCTFSCDIVVIGAGAVGIAMAVELTRQGSDVILLEAGGVSLDSRSQDIYKNARSSGSFLEGLHAGRFRLLGGTTNFWGGQLVRFDAPVLEGRSWVVPQGWPISLATLDPFYDRVFSLCAIGNIKMDDASVWSHLAAPKPVMGDDVEIFLSRWLPNPNFAQVFSGDIEGDKLTTIVHANVVGFSAGAEGGNVESVHLKTLDGREADVRASKVVLACGTVEICRLLMLPFWGGKAAPWNANPLLGRFFTDHIDSTAGEIKPKDRKSFHNLFDNIFIDGFKYQPKIKLSKMAQVEHEVLEACAQFLFTSSYDDHLANIKLFVRAIMTGRRPQNLMQVPSHLIALWKVLLPLAWRYFRTNRGFHPGNAGIYLRVTSEQLPNVESRISLRPERDVLGLPMVDVHWAIDGREIETIALFAERIDAALDEAGIARVEIDPLLKARDPAYMKGVDDTNHQMGGARMGATAVDGVVDANLKVFGAENLYVGGAAVFPVTGFANPTLTAIALGLRLVTI